MRVERKKESKEEVGKRGRCQYWEKTIGAVGNDKRGTIRLWNNFAFFVH